MSWRDGRAWRVIRTVWVTLGIAFTIYMFMSFAAWGVDDAVLESDADVRVEDGDSLLVFTPAMPRSDARLLFIPGGIVDPDAYAPLLHAVASAGYPATLVRLPFLGRHAAGDGGRRETAYRAVLAMAASDPDARWVVAGHSLGGAIASMVARQKPERMAALVLLGTTHPRDFSIADLAQPVIKVYGTRDGVAPLERSRENAVNLPSSTSWIAIEGGNHSQFGYYGFQVGDRPARISREEQHRQVAAILLAALAEAGRRPPDTAEG